MRIKDRLLFLKYALPCAGTLVKRGKVSQEYIDTLVRLVAEGNVPEEDAEKIFRVATAMCDAIGSRMGKGAVDCDVIRQYFLLEHSEVVDDRYKLMGDFNPTDCKTYAGKVLEVDGDSALIETRLGKKEYRTVFAKGVRSGDMVVVHFDFIVEKVPDGFRERMGA